MGALTGTTLGGAAASGNKPGHTLLGWNTDSTATVTDASIIETMTITESATYYAVWQHDNYTITFDYQSKLPNATGTGTYGGTLGELTGTTYGGANAATTPGYIITAWVPSPGGTTVTSGSIVTGSAKYYASWSAIQYTITYHLDGGTNSASNPGIYTIESGFTLKDPFKPGYTFAGWTTTSGSSVTVSGISSGSTGQVTLYAIWTTNNYTVNFTKDSGTIYATTSTAYNTSLGGMMPSVPSRTGYQFVGWSTSSGAMENQFTSSTAVTGSATYYAIWQAKACLVTFTKGNETYTTRGASYNTTLAGLMPENPQKAYNTFNGWYDGAGNVFTSNTAVTGNIEVFTRWKAIPGTIAGIVKDNDGNPVSGASVSVTMDIEVEDDINFIGFQTITTTVSITTTSNGAYEIPVQKSGDPYNVKITKPITIGDTTVNMTFEQKNSAGTSGSGTQVAVSEKTLTGVVLEKIENSTTTISATELAKYKIDLVASASSMAVASNVGISASGIFNIGGLSSGEYQLIMKYYPTADPSIYLIAGERTITIHEDGEINIVEALIDPYGTIIDAITKLPVSGATVALVYASDESTVALPAVADFPPADNANPQSSDSNGKYAFMVYPNTSYYVIATKVGYQNYKSPLIVVGTELVKHDFMMTPVAIQTVTGGNSSGNTLSNPPTTPPIMDGKGRDLAIAVVAEQMKLLEGSNGKLIIYAVNKSGAEMPETYVKVDIPETYQIPASVPGGTINGREITWNLGTLNPNTVKTINLELKVNNLNQGSLLSTLKAMIGTKQNIVLANSEDDLSILKLMLFSNRYQLSDKPYVTGYPDGDVKPISKVTRAEVAAMFTRLLQLTNDPSKATRFADVPDSQWYANYMEIMVEQGIFKGYEDGTIHPDQPITRAELGIAIARLLGISREQFGGELFRLSSFQDTNKHWAAATIEELYRFKIVSGDGATGFRPDNSITREESMKMINRLFYRGPLSGTDPSFPDNKKGYWSFGEIEEAARDHSYQVNEDGSEQLLY